MKIENRSKHDTHMLRAVLQFVKSKLYPSLSPRWMRGVVISPTRCDRPGGGKASNPIRITLGKDSAFPTPDWSIVKTKRHGYLGWPALNDKWECLAFLAGHEMEHRWQYKQAGRFSTQASRREDLCDGAGYDALDLFRKHRQEICMRAAKEAGRAMGRATARAMKKADRNSNEVKLEAVQRKMKEWNTKAKRAASALKKYRRKEKYYMTRIAASQEQRGAEHGKDKA